LPSPSPKPTAVPTARPVEAPLVIDWTRASLNDSEQFLYGAQRLRAFKGRFLAIPVYGTVIWASDDAVNWRPAFQVDGIAYLSDLAVNKDIAVAVSTTYGDTPPATWLSDDGLIWRRGEDLPAEFRSVGATSSGFVAIGDQTVWTSSDGNSWNRATDANSQHVAQGGGRLFTIKGETVAFVDVGSGLEVWRTTGHEWSKLSALPDSKDAFITNATQGPRGWVALGAGVWFSENGSSWQKARPRDVPKAAGVDSVIALDAGFVAAGFSGERGDVTCGTGAPLVAHTWTSRDGLRWAEMEQSLPDVAFTALYAREQTLYVLGSKQGRNSGTGVWTAPLPVADRPAQGVEPVRAPGTGGCGP
jgi:hypothetical protein